MSDHLSKSCMMLSACNQSFATIYIEVSGLSPLLKVSQARCSRLVMARSIQSVTYLVISDSDFDFTTIDHFRMTVTSRRGVTTSRKLATSSLTSNLCQAKAVPQRCIGTCRAHLQLHNSVTILPYLYWDATCDV